MSANVVSAVSSGAGRIGRYFTVVSALPAAVFVTYTYLLLRVTAWFGPVEWKRISDFRPQDVVIVGVVAMVMALALNPLQFPLIQLFEGYWGTSALAVELAVIRTAHHRRRLRMFESREESALPRYQVDASGDGRSAREEPGISGLRKAIVVAANRRAMGGYPELHRVLPTRLGNVMRLYEDGICRPYGLDPLASIPRLAMVAGQPEAGYLENQRVQLELAVRTTFLALLATPMTVAIMAHSEVWLLLAVAPYSVALLSYRGAVALAHEYGTSLAVLTDMTRFALYERLHLRHPRNISEERDTNEELMKLFRLRPHVSLAYEPPPPPPIQLNQVVAPGTPSGPQLDAAGSQPE